MAVNPKIVLMAIEAAGSEKIRKIVMYVVFFTLGLVILIYATYASAVSGIFGIVQSTALNNQWNIYSGIVSDMFKGLKSEINTDVNDEIKKFMPDFSYNLSKAVMSDSISDNELKIFDDEELSAARSVMITTADELRKIKTEKELENYSLGRNIEFSFSEIQNPEFLNDNGIKNIGSYDTKIREYLFHCAINKSKKYEYVVEPTEIDGRKATRQSLKLWGADGGLEKKVEYNCVGGSVYLPELLALYNIRVTKNDLDNESIDKQIEKVIGSIPQTPEDYVKYSINALKEAVIGNDASNLNVVKTLSIKALIDKAGIKNIASINTDTDDRTYSITLETISSDEWRKIFEIDESLQPYVEQSQMIIETALQSAKIPREKWYISLDGVVQLTFFEYFGGLFELPLEAGVEQGISSPYGNVGTLHEHNGGGVVENGLTLRFNKKSDIYAVLQPGCDKFVTDAFVYDVWDMEEKSPDNDSVLYNRSAVTIAYVIDLNKFKNAYGFQFPFIYGADRSSGFVTVFLEYSCLGRTQLQSKDAGSSVPVNAANKFYIGTSHSGRVNEKYNSGAWKHTEENGVCEPHVTVKVHVKGNKTERTKPGAKEYKGISTENMGVSVNPIIWVKGAGTDKDLPGNISAAQPK